MEKRARIVAVDYGTKRVGVAISDPLRLFASPEGTYSPEGVLARLKELSTDPGLETIVVGWPLTLDGEEGEATRLVDLFVRRLQHQITDVPIVRWDERYSSEQARRLLIESGRGRKSRRKKERIDAAAAAVILQEYLEEIRGV